jgi:hypothetical protein
MGKKRFEDTKGIILSCHVYLLSIYVKVATLSVPLFQLWFYEK